MEMASRGFSKPGVEVERDGDVGCCGYVLLIFSYLLMFLFFPFSLMISIKVIAEYERAVILRLGRVKADGAEGPGMIFVLPCVDEIQRVDLRTVAYDVPRQEVLTKDTVTVAVDAVIYYRVEDPIMSVCNVNGAFRSAQLLSATVLRNVLGTKFMAEVLSERDQIAQNMRTILDEATAPWGIDIERVEIKDVRLPFQLQRAMAAEAEAAREAKAKVVAAEGEQNASRALKEAADVMMESPAAMQLRYLQTLGQMATGKDSTIMFPIPIELGISTSNSSAGKRKPSSKPPPPPPADKKSPPPSAPVVKEVKPSAPPPPPETEMKPPPSRSSSEPDQVSVPVEVKTIARVGERDAIPDVEVTENKTNTPPPAVYMEKDLTVESMHL